MCDVLQQIVSHVQRFLTIEKLKSTTVITQYNRIALSLHGTREEVLL